MERYEIIITEKRKKAKNNVVGEDEKKPKSNVAGQEDEDESEKLAKEKKDRATTLKLIAKTAINDARSLIVPNVGEYMRDSLLQQKVDDTMGIIDTAISFAIHPVYGLINYSTKVAGKAIQYTMQNEKEQNRLSVSLLRAGYVNRSRE